VTFSPYLETLLEGKGGEERKGAENVWTDRSNCFMGPDTTEGEGRELGDSRARGGGRIYARSA